MDKWIIRENVPCWYELSWREKEPAIILRVHQDFIDSIPAVTSENFMVASFMKSFKFQRFSGDWQEKFGFDDGVFEYQGKQENGFLEYAISIPRIKIITEKPCKECNGTGKDLHWQERFQEEIKCHHCSGSGFELDYNWPLARAVSASFTIFFILSRYPEIETSAPFPQLMAIDTMTGTDMWHSGSLGGEFSIPMTQWLASHENDNETILKIVEAEKIAYCRMFEGDDGRYGFRANIRQGGGLSIDCPGDACGIHPDSWGIEKGRGYKFSCHNVDTAAQQLTLLAGLAALHDHVRKGMKKEV